MPDPQIQLDNLITSAQAGDVDAFNQVVLHFQDYVFTIAYRIMNDQSSASDMAQDAFFSAYRKLDTFKGGSFKAWIARITTNTCYDELRRRKRRPQDYLEDKIPDNGESLIPSDAPTPEQEAQRADLNQAIQDCIGALNDDQRIVLVMSDVEGYAYQEIADSVDVSLGTVKSRLSRARMSIRRCLQAVQELLPAEFRLTGEE